LDEEGRQAVRNLLEDWRGAAIVASHDRELLEHADRIVELSSVGVFIVGGSWREFEEARQAELERRKAELERRKRELKTAIRDRQRETEKQARRDKYGRKVASKDIDPRPYLFRQQQKAEKTAARYQQVGEDLVERAREQLNAAQAQVELLSPVRISLPRSGLASKHQLVRARGLVCERGGRRLFGPLDFDIRGPERIALQGPNGAGKTSLIRLIAGVDQPVAGELRADRFRIALLDQHLSLLGTSGTAAEAMRRLNPQMRDNEVHAALAAYGFRSRWGERALETLSGGERMRLALACLFSSPKPPQLLLLDEPTNHLDIASLEMLEAALESYDGALLCVSHDKVFLQAIGVSRSLDLSRRASPVTDGR
jgi:ATPase subunit of ABC transporter with duplicated ATPase domains